MSQLSDKVISVRCPEAEMTDDGWGAWQTG